MDDIVTRLRGKVEASSIYDDDEELLDAAADEIERQRADLADADRVIMRLNSGAELQAIMAAHNDALRERDALREALERIANLTEKWEHSLVSQVNEIARAALAPPAQASAPNQEQGS